MRWNTLPWIFASLHLLLAVGLAGWLLRDPNASVYVALLMTSIDTPVGSVIVNLIHPIYWAFPDAAGWIVLGFLAAFGTAWYWFLGWLISRLVVWHRARRRRDSAN